MDEDEHGLFLLVVGVLEDADATAKSPEEDPEDLANQPNAALEDGFDAVLEDDDVEGEEEKERGKNAYDDDDYPQSVDIFLLHSPQIKMVGITEKD